MTDLVVRGVGWWSPGVPDWTRARDLLLAADAWPADAGGRPSPALMPANERRRAPDSVLLAMAAAEQACAAAGLDPAALASVFVSTYGDLAISDYLCSALRDDAAALSPTRFHNSVHNAPAGYWSIATGAMAPSTSLAAGAAGFAAGLLEATCQIVDGDAPVLLVAYDIAGVGPMAEVSASTLPFGCALLLDRATAEAPDRIGVRVQARSAAPSEPVPALAAVAALCHRNPVAFAAMPLLDGLARRAATQLHLPLSQDLDLVLDVAA